MKDIRKSHYNSILGLLVLLINLFMALIPLWQGSFIWSYYKEQAEIEKAIFLPLSIVDIILFLMYLFLNHIKWNRAHLIIIFMSIFYALSTIINKAESGYFSIIAVPIAYIFIYSISSTLDLSRYKYLLIVLLFLWCLLPFIDYLISDNNRQILYTSSLLSDYSGFHGYAIHKNIYGYICGLCIIMIGLSTTHNKFMALLLIVSLMIPLIYSGCRSVLVALAVVIIFNSYWRIKKINIPSIIKWILGLSLVFGFIYLFISISFFEDPNRVYILNEFIEIIKQHFFFGTGTQTRVQGLIDETENPAHNFILQVIADRGIFSSILFFMVLYYLIKKNNKTYSSFVIYMIVVGLFQPYLTLAIPSFLMMLCFVLPCAFRNLNYVRNIR